MNILKKNYMINLHGFLFTILFIVFQSICFSQDTQTVVDSLKNKLLEIEKLTKSATNDTTKLKILEDLVESIYEDDIWIKYNNQAKLLSLQIIKKYNNSFAKRGYLGLGLSLNNEGFYQLNKANYPKAKKLFEQSLSILEKIDEHTHVATTLNNIGYIHKTEGNLVEALNFYFKSLKIREKINDESGKAMSYNNIGLIYLAQGNKNLAKENFIKCISILEKNDDKYQLSSTLNNLAIMYANEYDFNRALGLYARSKVLQKNIGDKNGEAYTYVNMGTVYQSQGDFEYAIKLFTQGLDLFKEINFEEGIAWAYHNIGNVYLAKNDFKSSNKFIDSSIFYARKVNQPELLQTSEKVYYQLDSARGNFLGAFEHYKNYVFYRDSITNIKSQEKNLQQRLSYEFDKKEAILKEQQEKQQILADEESQKQRYVIFTVIGILVLVGLFTVYVLRTLRVTQRQKTIIEKQKELVEAKQKEILDSIHYAKRIQEAILTSQIYIERNIKRLKRK